MVQIVLSAGLWDSVPIDSDRANSIWRNAAVIPHRCFACLFWWVWAALKDRANTRGRSSPQCGCGYALMSLRP